MKKSILLIFSLVIIAGFTTGFLPPPAPQTIAQAVKVIHDVSHKTASADWTAAKKGDLLASGDQLRTGERSIAIVKFLDGSMLRVRESSELKLLGEQKEGVLTKTVDVIRGEFSFDVNKQGANEKFTFSSPTSVAAIRGTAGTMGSSDSGDVLVVIDGLVNLLNSISQKAVDVAAGQTGVSNPDGSITVRTSTPAEASNAQNALSSTRNTGPEKSIDLEIKNQQGQKQKLHIRYH